MKTFTVIDYSQGVAVSVWAENRNKARFEGGSEMGCYGTDALELSVRREPLADHLAGKSPNYKEMHAFFHHLLPICDRCECTVQPDDSKAQELGEYSILCGDCVTIAAALKESQ